MKTEYLLVLPIEPFELGKRYPAGTSLPLHCTIMHWFEFKNDLDRNYLFEKLMTFDDYIKNIELVSKAPALFGLHNTIPVHVLERTSALEILHNRIFYLLATRSARMKELQWVGAGWNPHVTDGDRVFLPGERHCPKEIFCIERIDGGYKVVRTRWYIPE